MGGITPSIGQGGRMKRGEILLLIVAIAAVIRLWGLGEKSIWHDEAFTLLVAQHSLGEIPGMILRSENHPPGGYFLFHLWMRMGHSPFWLRLPSALFGILSVLLLYTLGRPWFRERTSLVAALLLALNGYHVFYSQEVRNYTLGIFFVIPILFLGFRLVEREATAGETAPGRFFLRDYGVLFLWCALALYVEYMTVFPMILLGIWFLLRVRRPGASWVRFLLFGGVVALAFLPWVWFMSGKLTRVVGESFWLSPPTLGDLATAVEFLVCGYPFASFALPILPLRVVVWGFLFLGVFAAFHPRLRATRIQTWLALVVLLPLFGFYLLSHFTPVFHPRFFIWFLPAACYLLAAGIMESPWERIMGGQRRGNAIRGGLLGLLLLFQLFTLSRYDGGTLYETTRRYAYDEAAAHLRTQWRAGDLVVHLEPFAMMPFRYLLPGIAQHQILPPGTDLPYYLGGTFLSEEEKIRDPDTLLRPGRRIWIVRFANRRYPPLFSSTAAQTYRIVSEERASFRGLEILRIRVAKASEARGER